MNASSSLSDYRQFTTAITTDYPQRYYCYCGLEAILKVVRAETPNKGRCFWSCKKFGSPSNATCRYFRWHDGGDESPSTVQNRSNKPDMPFILNNDNNANGKTEGNPLDQLPEARGNRNFNGSTSLSQAPGSRPQSPSPSNTANGNVGIPPITTTTTTTTTTANIPVDTDNTDDNETKDTHDTNNDINDAKTNANTTQLLELVQNYVAQQDKNYEKWYTASKSVKDDLNEAKKEVEKLKKDLKDANRENDLYEREKTVLTAEKRVLEDENNRLKLENQELKKRRC